MQDAANFDLGDFDDADHPSSGLFAVPLRGGSVVSRADERRRGGLSRTQRAGEEQRHGPLDRDGSRFPGRRGAADGSLRRARFTARSPGPRGSACAAGGHCGLDVCCGRGRRAAVLGARRALGGWSGARAASAFAEAVGCAARASVAERAGGRGISRQARGGCGSTAGGRVFRSRRWPVGMRRERSWVLAGRGRAQGFARASVGAVAVVAELRVERGVARVPRVRRVGASRAVVLSGRGVARQRAIALRVVRWRSSLRFLGLATGRTSDARRSGCCVRACVDGGARRDGDRSRVDGRRRCLVARRAWSVVDATRR